MIQVFSTFFLKTRNPSLLREVEGLPSREGSRSTLASFHIRRLVNPGVCVSRGLRCPGTLREMAEGLRDGRLAPSHKDS